MVSVRIRHLICWGLIILMLFSASQTVWANQLEEAELPDLSFQSVWETVKEMLWGEFVLLRLKIPTLMVLIILVGIKNCMDFPLSLNRTVHLGIFCAMALCSGELFRELSEVAENCITHLCELMYLTIPVLTGLVANGGRMLSAVKSTYFMLGFMNLLVFLMKHIFLPGIFIYFMCTVFSPFLEKDYFGALKQVILWSVKTVLPILIGIFLTVFSLLTTVTKASDSLTLQSAKMALGNCIPFLGNTLSSSCEYLIQTLSHIKSKTGLAGVFTASYVFLSPLVKLVAGLLTFQALSVCAGFLSDDKTTQFFQDTATGLGMLTGVVATVSVISVLGIMVLIGI